MRTQSIIKYPAIIALSCVVAACSSNPKVAEPDIGAALSAPSSTSAEIVNTPRGPSLTLDNVLFDFEQSSLRDRASGTVHKAVVYLNENPNSYALIEGHTDHTGDKQYNQSLSMQRSESVKAALIADGISESRIKTTGFGETKPVAENSSPTGRQANRRVEIIFPQN